MTNPVTIIAEAGVNHNGDFETALRLMDRAREAGADVVKFQSFMAKKLVTGTAAKAEYQKKNLGDVVGTQYEMLKKLELSFEHQRRLFAYGKKIGIRMTSTPFDEESIDFLATMDIPFWKIPSGEINNTPYLRKIGRFGQPVVLSTGMSTLGDIEYALDVLESSGTGRNLVTVLHCTTEYPAPVEEVNLGVMKTIADCFGVKTGYSDHTKGISVPIAAVALGAVVIEKHFTLDRNMPGPDHAASLESDELKRMINAIREVEKALGDGIKRITTAEKKNIAVARKSIVAGKRIRTGESFTEDNLAVKRPGTGLSPRYWDLMLGRKADRDYDPDEAIQ